LAIGSVQFPALVLQLSDLHISDFSPDSTRAIDLMALGIAHVSVWRPDAVIISGVMFLPQI
jgi:predicted MPP superfamily phosphohydrolase